MASWCIVQQSFADCIFLLLLHDCLYQRFKWRCNSRGCILLEKGLYNPLVLVKLKAWSLSRWCIYWLKVKWENLLTFLAGDKVGSNAQVVISEWCKDATFQFHLFKKRKLQCSLGSGTCTSISTCPTFLEDVPCAANFVRLFETGLLETSYSPLEHSALNRDMPNPREWDNLSIVRCLWALVMCYRECLTLAVNVLFEIISILPSCLSSCMINMRSHCSGFKELPERADIVFSIFLIEEVKYPDGKAVVRERKGVVIDFADLISWDNTSSAQPVQPLMFCSKNFSIRGVLAPPSMRRLYQLWEQDLRALIGRR